MPLGLLSRAFKVPIYVDFGRGDVELREAKVEGNCTVLDATRRAYNVEYSPSDEASGHRGAVVIAIEGVRADLSHGWVFYVHDERLGGWYFPSQTCDKVELRRGNAVCWRYYDHKLEGFPPKGPPLTRERARFASEHQA